MNIQIPDIASKLSGLTGGVTSALTSKLGSVDVKSLIGDKVGGIATKYKEQISAGLTGKFSEMTQFDSLGDFNISSITEGAGVDLDVNSKMQEMLNGMDISSFD